MINDESSTVEVYAWLVVNHLKTLTDMALLEGNWSRYKALKEALNVAEKYYPTEKNNYCMDLIGSDEI